MRETLDKNLEKSNKSRLSLDIPGFMAAPHCNNAIASAIHPAEIPLPRRFTLDGDAYLERDLLAACESVRNQVCKMIPRGDLEGVLLGGGYGRGEGGVLRTADGDCPYNDLEFYVFVGGSALLAERKYACALTRLGRQLSAAIGVDVEFKVLTRHKLSRSATSMFYYDLFHGHRWLVGDDRLLSGCEHHRTAAQIPLHEATRLLMNRCSGLLFSAERLHRKDFGDGEADFVQRNLAKAQLAMGDVLLAALGKYHWSCLERHARLNELPLIHSYPRLVDVCRHHASGVEFKLHPFRSTASRECLQGQLNEITTLAGELWLWLEQRRLRRPFLSHRDYVASRLHKCPETFPWRNRLVNARSFGLLQLFHPQAGIYPRQRLFNALSLLLWMPETRPGRNYLKLVRRELKTRASDFAGLVAAYENLWHRFN